MAPNFPNLMKDQNLHIQGIQQIPSRKTSKRSTHYSQTAKGQRQKNLEISKTETTHHIQGIHSKIKSFFFRNHRCQKAEG